MDCITLDRLPEALVKKIAVVSRANTHLVRKVTRDEACLIGSLAGWFDGYFIDDKGVQIVLDQRPCGQSVIFSL